jgi:hypothetical protein
MCYWILTELGKVVVYTSIQHVTHDELLDDTLKATVAEFDKAVNICLDDTNFVNCEAGDFYLDDEYVWRGIGVSGEASLPDESNERKVMNLL